MRLLWARNTLYRLQEVRPSMYLSVHLQLHSACFSLQAGIKTTRLLPSVCVRAHEQPVLHLYSCLLLLPSVIMYFKRDHYFVIAAPPDLPAAIAMTANTGDATAAAGATAAAAAAADTPVCLCVDTLCTLRKDRPHFCAARQRQWPVCPSHTYSSARTPGGWTD